MRCLLLPLLVAGCNCGLFGEGAGGGGGGAEDEDAGGGGGGGSSCGDGVVQRDEPCDDGNDIPSDGCLPSCVPATCGDGIVWAGVETCDDGNADDSDACPTGCELASCGDGFVHRGFEACDDGNASDADACLGSCRVARCGDGRVRADVEGCDDGNTDDHDACPTTCEPAWCGDGFVELGVEQCDDANGSDGDHCVADCRLARCGDGYVERLVEECDDANALDNDACLSDCREATCGDGFVEFGAEECDDANADDSDDCRNDCQRTCDPPYTNCDGLCIDLDSDRWNCGDCGFACSPCESCEDGVCEWSGIAVDGPREPLVARNLADVGTRAWDDPDLATVEDGLDARGALDGAASITAMVDGETSNYLVATDFGFEVPDGVTVLGLFVGMKSRSWHGTGISTGDVRTILDGAIGGTGDGPLSTWADEWVWRGYGAEDDLFDGEFTPDDVNDPRFGFAVSVSYHDYSDRDDWPMIDVVRAAVFYECL